MRTNTPEGSEPSVKEIENEVIPDEDDSEEDISLKLLEGILEEASE
jgi:hypothetical protein